MSTSFASFLLTPSRFICPSFLLFFLPFFLLFILPLPLPGRDHVIEGSSVPSSRSLDLFNRLSSRFLGDVVFKQLSVLERWWWRPPGDAAAAIDADEDAFDADFDPTPQPAWLLINDSQRLSWTFYCVQPVFFVDVDSSLSSASSPSSWLTMVTCCERRLAPLAEELASTRFASLTSFVSLAAAAASTASSSLVSGPGSRISSVPLFPSNDGRRKSQGKGMIDRNQSPSVIYLIGPSV